MSRRADYIVFTIALLALAVIAIDRHRQMQVAQHGLVVAGEQLRACQAEVNYLDGKNN